MTKVYPTEYQEQVLYFDILKIKYPELYEMAAAVPNQFTAPSNQMRKRVREGLSKGYPDILIDYPIGVYHGLRIEMKRELKSLSRTSDEQIGWIERLNDKGFIACVCYGADEALDLTARYWQGMVGDQG